MKIATKDLKDEALLWAAVKVTWPNDTCVLKPDECSKASMVELYARAENKLDVLSALVQAKLGEFVDVPNHLV